MRRWTAVAVAHGIATRAAGRATEVATTAGMAIVPAAVGRTAAMIVIGTAGMVVAGHIVGVLVDGLDGQFYYCHSLSFHFLSTFGSADVGPASRRFTFTPRAIESGGPICASRGVLFIRLA